jgi:hypothetical protein
LFEKFGEEVCTEGNEGNEGVLPWLSLLTFVKNLRKKMGLFTEGNEVNEGGRRGLHRR